MTALAHRITTMRGWGRWVIALLAGAAGALAMPPFGFVPALVLSLAPAVWLLDGTMGPAPARLAPFRSAALLGWAWGFGYFIAGLWWLGAAFLVEADQFAWALPFGVLGLPALLAFFPALGFALARLLWTKSGWRVFALVVGLGVAEWLRGHLFTGFPWNALGMALGQNLWLMQAASIMGLYGLTLLAIGVGAAPAVLGTGGTRVTRWTAPALALGTLGALMAYGVWRVPAEATPLLDNVRLRLMQPNLPQDAKFNPRNRDAIMRRYLAISSMRVEGRGVEDATHLIWPESAFPFLLHRDAAALAQIAALLPPGVSLITGAARMEDPLPGESVGRFFNAIQVVRDDGTIDGTYDKVHLVPFGEYVPRFVDALIRAVGLRQFVHIPGGFSAAERRLPLRVPGLPPLAANVCYEAIFPGAVLPEEGERPSLILNVTNDAWFGATPGPHQHFAQARLRSVEEGLPLVRNANTGISAVVDPYGRVIVSLPLGTEGVADSDLPLALPPTPFAGLGIAILAGMFAVSLALSLTGRLHRPSPPPYA